MEVIVARIQVITFQKRVLPHYQMLLWVRPEDVPQISGAIDATISAEIPNKETEPRLHAILMPKHDSLTIGEEH